MERYGLAHLNKQVEHLTKMVTTNVKPTLTNTFQVKISLPDIYDTIDSMLYLKILDIKKIIFIQRMDMLRCQFIFCHFFYGKNYFFLLLSALEQ